MHELSIATSIVKNILNFAADHHVEQVIVVRLAIGELTCIQDEQLRFCFSSIAKETIIGESTLEIETLAARVKCPHCYYAGPPKYWTESVVGTAIPTLQCPECGKAAEATQGHECFITSMKYVG